MFQKGIEIIFSERSPSDFPNNLSICRDTTANLMYACFAHVNQVSTLQWNANADYASNGSIFLETKTLGKSSTIIQTKFCLPLSISSPYLVVAASNGAVIYSLTSEAVLAWFPLNVLINTGATMDKACHFTKGIACIDDFILIGTSNGHIIVFDCSKPGTVSFKKVIAEHTSAVVDIATCQKEKLCCSCDISGSIIVWGKNFRSLQKKITTKLNFSCMSIYGRRIVVGTYTGKILFFCADLGVLLIDINAHIRQINALVVSNDCSKMLSISEDSFLRVWHLDDNKGGNCKVDCLQNERMENKALVGAQFLDDAGAAFAVAAYDYSKLSFYEISKVTDSVTKT